MQTFLSKYNYISTTTRSGSPDLKAAIEKYQTFMGLPVSGELDEATLNEMKQPRCGMADVHDQESRFHTYKRWQKTNLKYYIWFSRDKHLSYEVQEKVFRQAFDAWAAAAPKLNFTRTYCLKEADIKIT